MNLILLNEKDFISPHRVMIQERRFHHIKSVHRAGVGDQLVTGLINGKMGTSTITSLTSSSIEMDVVLDETPPPPLDLNLVMALPRPKMLKRILQTVASLGVKKIYIINSWRVEKGFWSSPLLEKEKIEEQLVLGLEQAKDTIMPEVFLEKLFMPFIREKLPMISRESLKLTAHPRGSTVCPCHPGRKITLAVGPEGGFIPKEIDTLGEIGFTSVSLGARILRLETAVPFLISRLFT